jgi:hypothetical protein
LRLQAFGARCIFADGRIAQGDNETRRALHTQHGRALRPWSCADPNRTLKSPSTGRSLVVF